MFPQVALLKKRMKGVSDGAAPLEGDVNQAENAAESSPQSPSKKQGEEPEATEGNEISLVPLKAFMLFLGVFLMVALHFLLRRGQQ